MFDNYGSGDRLKILIHINNTANQEEKNLEGNVLTKLYFLDSPQGPCANSLEQQ